LRAIALSALLLACGTRTEIIVELETNIDDVAYYVVEVSGSGDRIEKLPRNIDGELPSFGVAPLAGEIDRVVTLEISGRNSADEEVGSLTQEVSGFAKNQRKRVRICVCRELEDGGVDGGIDASADAGDAGIDAGDAGDKDATTPGDGGDGGTPPDALLLHLGGANDDRAGDIAVDSAGNIIVVGTFENAIVLAPGEMLTGGTDAFVVKYDRDGVFQWAHTIDTSAGIVEATSVAINSLDEIYVGGSFQNQLAYDGAVVIDSPGAASRGFIVKVEPILGALAGQLVIETTGRASVSDLAIGGTTEEVFAGGEYHGAGMASAGCPLNELDGNSSTDRDGFVLAAASNLTCIWTQRLGAAFNEEVRAVAATADMVYAAGSFDDVVVVPPSALGSSGFSGGRAAMVLASSVDGAPLGLMALGHTDASAEGLAIAANASSVFVGGSFADSQLQVNIVSPDGKDSNFSAADDQILFAQFPPDFSPVTVLETTSTVALTLNAMTLDRAGVLAAGHLVGELDLDTEYITVGRGAFLLRAPAADNPSGFLADSTSDEELVGVAVDPTGRTVVLGMFGPTIALPGAGLITRGGNDIFVYAF
jgi:hypothetical protein